ncbi:uncharacterized protein LOC134291799 [Aedes albopictus]|uniref:THAP-type domain-containing protein n=1 Tax=Aedes albopictus TaxID=7160 RepID=A0ABM1ZHU7_AEDAL
MGYKRCCIPTCTNSTHLKDKSFLNLSTKNRTIWRTIIEATCGIDLPENSYICEDHFEDTDFLNVDNKSQGVYNYAVPKIDPESDTFCSVVEEHCPMDFDFGTGACENEYVCAIAGHSQDDQSEVEEGSVLDSDTVDVNVTNAPVMKRVTPAIEHDHDYLNDPFRSIMIAEKMVEMEAREERLKRELRKKTKKMHKKDVRIKKLRTELARLKQQVKKQDEDQLVDPILLELQANKLRKSGGARYSDSMKHLALILHYCSVKAYKQMRQIFAFPSVSTLRKWLAQIDVGEGFSANIFNLLKIKASFQSKIKHTISLSKVDPISEDADAKNGILEKQPIIYRIP